MFDSPDSTMAPALTLQDCVDRLDAGLIPYSAANAKKVRGSANKCARLPSFNCPIMRIPADPVRFARTWRPYVERGETPEGFNTHAQFKTWLSNVHNLMLHATGLHAQRQALAAQVDDWTALEAAFEDLLRPGKSGLGFRQEDLFALHVLRNAAREDLLQPRDITAAVIYRFKLVATTGQKSSLTRAGRLLDRLRDSGAIPARLLPAQAIGAIPRADHRRQTPQFSPRVVAALARYREELAEGRPLEGFLKGLRTEGLSPETVKNELDGLNWYFSALIALDMLEPSEDPEPESFFTLSMIEAVFDAEADGTLPWKPLAPSTVKKNLGAVFRYAARLNPDFRLVGRVFFRKGFFDQCDGMTETNRADKMRGLARHTVRPRVRRDFAAPPRRHPWISRSLQAVDSAPHEPDGRKSRDPEETNARASERPPAPCDMPDKKAPFACFARSVPQARRGAARTPGGGTRAPNGRSRCRAGIGPASACVGRRGDVDSEGRNKVEIWRSCGPRRGRFRFGAMPQRT